VLRAAWALALAGCAPWRFVESLCDIEPPPPGTVRIETLRCSEQVPPGGAGRVGADLVVATPWYRAVLRHPQDALTLSGVGGLTLIDWARWEGSDVLHEVAPLVGGGWLRPTHWEISEASLQVHGEVGPLPDEPIDDADEAVVTWQFPPDRPCLTASGADGWWLHGAGGVSRHGQALHRDGLALVSGGEVTTDLGGALRLAGGELCLDTEERAWSWLGEQSLDGRSDGDIELWAGDRLVGRLPSDALPTTVPVDVTEVRAVADDAVPGPRSPTGTDLELYTGARGSLRVQAPADGRRRVLTWTHVDGRTGVEVLADDEVEVGTGAGQVEISVRGGPTEEVWQASVDVPEGPSVPVQVTPTTRFDPGSWAAVGLGLPSDRSRRWRGTDAEALAVGAGSGFDYVALLVEDGTTEVDPADEGFPRMVAHGGSSYAGHLGTEPWFVQAWPVRSSDKKNAWGTIQYPVDDPVLALQLAQGGGNRLRTLAVDLATLELLGAPHAPDTPPNMVHLEAPDEGLTGWSSWFRWLDAAQLLAPAGPVVWVPVPDPAQVTLAEVDQGLRRGDVVAGSGERLEVAVGELGPGDLAPAPDQPTAATGSTGSTGDTSDTAGITDTAGTTDTGVDGTSWTVTVAAPTPGLDRLRIVGAGGRVLYDGPAEDTVQALDADGVGRWLVVVGTGPDAAWCVTGPVWLDPPR